MSLKRREILLGLLGATIPIIASSCVSEKTGSSSTSSEPAANTAATSTASPASGAAPAKIRIGYQVIPNPELLAKSLELAKKAFPDSQVEYISFDSGRDINTAIAAKGIDFGALGTVPASVGIAQGLPYQTYYILDVIGAAEALVVKDGIKSVADLKGKKVATPFGSTAHFSLESLLAQENISQKDLKILDMQPPEIVAAWQRGDIDAAYVWQPNLGKLLKDGGKVLISSADLAKKGIITADLGVVRSEFAQQYPEVVKKYVEVLNEAVKAYRADPDSATKALSKELNITPEETASAVKELIWLDSTEQQKPEYLGTADKPGAFAKILKDSADFAVKQKKITSAPDLAAYEKSLYTKSL